MHFWRVWVSPFFLDLIFLQFQHDIHYISDKRGFYWGGTLKWGWGALCNIGAGGGGGGLWPLSIYVEKALV